jgi:hypothetical protein
VAQPIQWSEAPRRSLCWASRTVAPNKVLSGFSNQTVWLIFTAFLFARAVTATGVGMRLAFFFIRRFGHSALTLGYSVAASDLVLAPFVPSDTARGGGIIYPITRSLAQVFHSEPGPTAGRLGAFLILVGYHALAGTGGGVLNHSFSGAPSPHETHGLLVGEVARPSPAYFRSSWCLTCSIACIRRRSAVRRPART